MKTLFLKNLNPFTGNSNAFGTTDSGTDKRCLQSKMAQKHKLDNYDGYYACETESLSSFESVEDIIHRGVDIDIDNAPYKRLNPGQHMTTTRMTYHKQYILTKPK
ncbi:hypothetical protein TNCV_1038501 [Trichonephila clavipes]|uniref:Uncharacterized protein n=1 Tax=Trichonephila clavipes TaxID=2585209 RepID=A0A8X7B8Q6_TRICX|nr:hypothetical protein TNCV_1038501 [Trichonephila clavipes]